MAHVAKAKHVAISNKNFSKELEKVRGKASLTKMAFCCNGYTCAKSYKAARKAMADGLENVYASDAGVFEWISSHADKGTLLG